MNIKITILNYDTKDNIQQLNYNNTIHLSVVKLFKDKD